MILICGATGTIGSRVTGVLSEARASVRALVRDGNTAQVPDGVVSVAGDLARPETLPAALAGVESVFLLSPVSPVQEAMEGNLIDAAVSARIRRIVKLSVIGAATDSANEFGRLHRRVEARLAASGMEYTILRPNMMMQNLFWYGQAIAQGSLPLPLGNAAVSHVDAGDIAVVAAVALTGRGHEGKIYTLTGPEALTCDAVATAFSERLGKPVRYQPIRSEDFRAFLAGAGEAPSTIDAECELFAEWSRGAGAEVTETVQAVTGRPAATLAEFIRRNEAVFVPLQRA